MQNLFFLWAVQQRVGSISLRLRDAYYYSLDVFFCATPQNNETFMNLSDYSNLPNILTNDLVAILQNFIPTRVAYIIIVSVSSNSTFIYWSYSGNLSISFSILQRRSKSKGSTVKFLSDVGSSYILRYTSAVSSNLNSSLPVTNDQTLIHLSLP